jgi:alpha-1,2-mannosyltransferase
VVAAAASTVFMAWWLHWFDLVDLEVYRAGASAFLHGRDIYQARPRVIPLPFTYPPFAAVAFAPLAVLPDLAARVAMSALSAAALLFSVVALLRLAAPTMESRRRWAVALAVLAATPLIEPVRDTFRLGQINLVLMALVLADLVAIVQGRKGRGILLGLATAVKLTPGVFILYLLVIGRRREALTAAASAAAATALAALLMPSASGRYWGHLVFDDRRIGSAGNVWNQSLRGAVARFMGAADRGQAVWLVLALVVACVGLALAARLHAGGEPVLGIGVAAVVGLLVSPISWNHHWVWALPLAVGLWQRAVTVPDRTNWWLAGGWTATFCLASISWWPFARQDDYHLTGLNAVSAECYVIVAVVVALVVARVVPGGRKLSGVPTPPRRSQ